ncbi:hypothetical protein V1511DRAFT_489119 [Dipodascopsis uninucleata]
MIRSLQSLYIGGAIGASKSYGLSSRCQLIPGRIYTCYIAVKHTRLLKTKSGSANTTSAKTQLFDKLNPYSSDSELSSRKVVDSILDKIEARRERLDDLASISPLSQIDISSALNTTKNSIDSQQYQQPIIEIGDFVSTKNGYNGIVVDIKFTRASAVFVLLTASRNLTLVNQSSVDYVDKCFIPSSVAENSIVNTKLMLSDPLIGGNALLKSQIYGGINNVRVLNEAEPQDAIVAPVQISVSVCKPLREYLSKAAELASIVLPVMMKVYEVISEESISKIVSLNDITTVVCKHIQAETNASKSELQYAVHMALCADQYKWGVHAFGDWTQKEYLVRSREQLTQILTGIELLRDSNSNFYKSFQSKCKNLIDNYRKKIGKHPGFAEFSTEDSCAIRLIESYALHNMDANAAARTLIPRFLKGLDRYDTAEYSSGIAFKLLVEIGIFSPFHDPIYLDPWTQDKLALYEMPEHTGDSTLNKLDAMNSSRYDFGMLPVYCIDGPNAAEIDDGFSIETVSGGREIWVHVHIANPSAILTPDHAEALKAARSVSSFYLPQITRLMLSKELIKSCQLSEDNNGTGIRTLTFSAKIGIAEDGKFMNDILEFKVASSTVRNVKTLIYSDVESALDWKLSYTDIGYPENYGPAPFIKSKGTVAYGTGRKLDSTDIETLKLAHKLSRFLFARRLEDGAMNASFGIDSLSIVPTPTADMLRVSLNRALYANDTVHPSIEVDHGLLNSNDVVAEMMILASRIAARYAQKQGIVVPFRTQQYFGNPSDLDSPDLKVTEKGFRILKSNILHESPNLVAGYSTVPGSHLGLGASEGYVHVTSPLRRYIDMVSHWQFQAHMSGVEPLFSEKQLKEICSNVTRVSRWSARIQRQAQRRWLVRKLQELQAISPDSIRLTGILLEDLNFPQPVQVECLDMNLRFSAKFDQPVNAKAGTFVVCDRIDTIDWVEMNLMMNVSEMYE